MLFDTRVVLFIRLTENIALTEDLINKISAFIYARFDLLESLLNNNGELPSPSIIIPEFPILRQNLKRYAKFDKIKYLKNRKPTKFKKGQFVKLFRKKGAFTKGYAQNVTKEYFKIYHIDRKLSKDRYYLKDLAGDKVIGSFYEEYLVLYKPPAEGAEYKVDPNHNDFRRKNIRGVPHIFVKWLGWPKKFNQWVPVNDVRHLL